MKTFWNHSIAIPLAFSVLLSVAVCPAAAQLSVGPAGLAPQTFDVAPPVTEWSTVGVGPSSASSIATTAQLDAAVQTNTAAFVDGILATDTTTSVPGLFATARWNSSRHFVETRANGNSYLLLKASLRNNSGGDISTIFINYDLGALVAAGSSIVEEIPGCRVYYSFTGATGSWTQIPELNSPSASFQGTMSAMLTFESAWPSGAVLYLLFADDNGSTGSTAPNHEGAYTIDNFAVALPPPGIFSQPQSQSAAPNVNVDVTFAVGASGAPPLLYQWRKNSNDIARATNQTYTIYNVQQTNSGFYSVVVSNAYGTVTSANAFLEVACPASVVITAQPQDQNIYAGQTLLLSVAADGTPPFFYQWFHEGTAIPSGTNQTYQKISAAVSDAGVYVVTVSNCAGPVSSAAASVRVSEPPYLLAGLTNEIWHYDQSGLDLGIAWKEVAFDDSAWPSGRGVLAVENNLVVRLLTNTVLSLTNSGGASVITYYFRTHFTLTNPPLDVSVLLSNLVDDGAVFYINGTEFARVRMPLGPILYNTTAAAIAPEAVFSNIMIPKDALVQGDNVLAVEVHQVSEGSSDIVFGAALIAENVPPGPPRIAAHPRDASVFPGNDVTLSVSLASGSGAHYQWFQNGAALPGAGSSALTLTNVSFNQNGAYFVVISNSFGAVTSSVAAVNLIGGDAHLRLLEFTSAWSFNSLGLDPGTAWRASNYDDSSWLTGPGVLLSSFQSGFPEPTNQALSLTGISGNSVTTFYFRVHFMLPPGASNVVLLASNLLDDGAVFYLNGSEAGRIRLNDPVTATTLAALSPSGGTAYEILILSTTNLVPGDNVLAVEVHQTSADSSDVVFGMNLRAFGAFNQPVLDLTPPASQAGEEGLPVSFSAIVFGGPPLFIQWFHDGMAMAGETNLALVIPALHGADAGGYFFIASNSLNSVTGTVSTLTVIADVARPALVAAFATNDPEGVVVIFSEPVTAQSATNIANYALAPGVDILSAQMIAPNRVLLRTSVLSVLFDYTLTISNIVDLADSPNVIPPGSATRVQPNRLGVATGLLQVQTVFVIVMENKAWSDIKANPDAPYLNSLLDAASYCETYTSPANLHPSQPNYIWLEAGDHFGHADDDGPAVDRVSSTNHLASQLARAGIEWRGYMESMPYGSTGVSNGYPYLARHNPFAFFDDVTMDYGYCTNHVRPYAEFAGDLAAGRIGRYNFITPNITNDMHNFAPGSTSLIKQGDDWLAQELPQILGSAAFSNNGAVFITWDENDFSTDYPIGMIVLSPLAKGNGYASRVPYDHSSTLRTMQEIFRVRPYLGGAMTASPLNDLFKDLSLKMVPANGLYQVLLEHMLPGRTNYVQASPDLVSWTTISTNIATNTVTIIDPGADGASRRFYRAVERP